MQSGLPSEDECPLWGQTLYVHGNSLDAPLAVVRSNYREYQYVNPQWNLRTFPTFVLYPLWNARGEPDLATSITGKSTVCVTTDTPPCAQDFGWPAGMTPYMQQQWVKLSWLGSLLDDKRDAGLASGLTYRRNRYVDGRTGRFSQPDPIGLTGGLNTYGFTSGDPVNFGDPFGLCPFEKDQIPCPDGIERIGVTDPRSIGIMLSAAILVEAGAAVGSTVRLVFGIVKDVASTLTRSTTRNDVGPGQNASSSVPSSTTGKAPREEQEAVNEIGSATGCHTCGARAPGTKSGNWVGDHQPPTSLNTRGLPQRLFPQCASCSREQGLTIIKYLKGIGAIK